MALAQEKRVIVARSLQLTDNVIRQRASASANIMRNEVGTIARVGYPSWETQLTQAD